MEENKLDITYYKKELESAIMEIHDAQLEIQALEKENAELIEKLEVTSGKFSIETKAPIKSIEIYFK